MIGSASIMRPIVAGMVSKNASRMALLSSVRNTSRRFATTVTLPLLSRLVVANRLDVFRTELSKAMRLAFLLTIPATIGLMMLAEPIISLLYQHGKFNAYQTAQTAGALRYYAIGLAGYAALKVLVNAFYALDRRKTPMLVSFLAVGLNLLFNWTFTFRLGWGHRGLAFSTGL